MKHLLFLFIILTSCATPQIRQTQEINSDELSLEIDINNNKEVILTLTNNGERNLTIGNPCGINTNRHLLNEQQEIMPSIKVKPNPNCIYPLIELSPKNSKTAVYSYSFNKLYSHLEPNQQYSFYMTYYIGSTSVRSNIVTINT